MHAGDIGWVVSLLLSSAYRGLKLPFVHVVVAAVICRFYMGEGRKRRRRRKKRRRKMMMMMMRRRRRRRR